MADTSFFGRLTKLFRAQAVVTVDKDGKRRVVDTDERQQTNLSSLRDRYTKIQKSFFEQSGGGNAMFQSVEGEVEWDAQGVVDWQWSTWEQDQSGTVGTNIQLDALHLDITLSGDLQKE